MTTLELEVDFNYKGGNVGLRFFEVDDDGDRFPLRAQRLYNLLAKSRKVDGSLDPDFRDLLIRLAPEISKPAVIAANLQVLPVPHARWSRLKSHKAVAKSKVKDHASGAVINEEASIPLYFELECHGEKTRFSAVLDAPSGPVAWHRVRDGVRQRRTSGKEAKAIVEAVLDGALYPLDLPVDIALLNQLFGVDNQRINTDAIPAALPVLIDHRLDRLRGPSVTHRRETVVPELKLASDGGYIVVTATANGIPIRFDRPKGAMTVIREGGGFAVIEYHCRHFGQLKRFFQGLDAVRDDAGYRILGTADAVMRLTDQLTKLPPGLPVAKDGDLEHLTGAPSTISTNLAVSDHGGWFEIGLECRIGDERIGLADLRRAAHDGSGVMRTRGGHWFKVDDDELAALIEATEPLDERGNRTELRTQLPATIERLGSLPNLNRQTTAAQLAEKVRRESTANTVTLSEGLRNPLRGYQVDGVNFLCSRAANGVGPLLADDMGLGKTVQVLTAIQAMKDHGIFNGPTLIVCPASVIYVWEREAATFVPELKVALLIGQPAERAALLADASFDLAVCSYAIMRNDLDSINAIPFDVAVLDEAQTIRNPSAQVTQAAWGLRASKRIALTGTPLENRLTDLWSIMNFLNPGYLGNQKAFEARYGKSGGPSLVKRLEPLLLRRRKQDVAADLPEKTEEVIRIPFEPEQAAVYAAHLAEARKATRGTMQLLAALTRLRQLCCDPRLVLDEFPYAAGKMTLLRETVEELLDEGHSVLVFSQFTSMLELIRDELSTRGCDHLMLTGETRGAERRRLVESFNATTSPQVFLLSLKAAGTGLTLTKADYVIVFDPWWNPASENQAIDRAHRIGQTKPVIAYRFIMAGSVEEKVLELQAEKRELFESVVDGVNPTDTALSADALADLLR